MLSLARVYQADKCTTYTVFGFIRRLRRLIQVDKNMDIPPEIFYVAIDYYLILEKFSEHGNGLKLSRNHAAITMVSPNNTRERSAYGDVIIDISDSSISQYIWDISVEGDLKNPIGIGIDSNDPIEREWILNTNFALNICGSQHYSFQIWGDLGFITLIPKNGDTQYVALKPYDRKDNDRMVITLIADMTKKSVVLNIDDKKVTHHQDIEIKNQKFRFAISLSTKTQKINIEKFSIIQ